MNDYHMFSKAGNLAVARMVVRITKMPDLSERRVRIKLHIEMSKIAVKHPEVHDTMVRESIAANIERLTGVWLSICGF